MSGVYPVGSQLVDAEQKSLVDTLGVQLGKQLHGQVAANTSTYPRIGQLLAIAHRHPGTDARPAERRRLRRPPEPGRCPPADGAGRQPGDGTAGARGDRAPRSTRPSPTACWPAWPPRRAGWSRSARRVRPTWSGSAPTASPDSVTTVDGTETSAGRVAAVLALIRSWSKQGGAYGASGSDGSAPLG